MQKEGEWCTDVHHECDEPFGICEEGLWCRPSKLDGYCEPGTCTKKETGYLGNMKEGKLDQK